MAEFITEKRDNFLTLLSCKVEQDETTIIIPNEVEKLERNCFNGLKNIKNITLSENIRTLYYIYFRDLESLEYIDIKNVKFIPTGTFFDCRKLKTIKSNNKVFLKYCSLLHCFSLKEINCEEKDIERALGDTKIFEYPLLNKDLDIARIKIDFDFKKARNQKEYIESWPDNLESRSKREFVLFDDLEPVCVLEATDFNSNPLADFDYITGEFSDNICDLGAFERVEGILPWPTAMNVDYQTFVSNLEDELETKFKDYESPRTTLNSVEDALYFFKLLYLEQEINEIGYEIQLDELQNRLQEYLFFHKNYCIAINDTKNAAIFDSLMQKAKKLDEAYPKMKKMFSFGTMLSDILKTVFPEFVDILYDIVDAATIIIYKALLKHYGRNADGIENYYKTAPCNNCVVYDYYSLSFRGDVNHTLYLTSAFEDESWYQRIWNMYAYNMPSMSLRERLLLTVYSTYFLRDDQESLQMIQDRWEDPCDTSIIVPEYFNYLVKNSITSEIKSSLIWYTCGLKPEDIDYLKFMLSEDYAFEIMPDDKWSYFLVAFDIENIILSHDFYSFKIIYDLTKNMKDEDWYQPFNFYFDECALVISGSSLETIDILNEEAFNTISEVNDQPID